MITEPSSSLQEKRPGQLEFEAGQSQLSSPKPERLLGYIVSDVHLNNHPYDTAESENPRRRHFREFLSHLNETVQPTDKLLLILNGDVLDITGSWFETPMPWDSDTERVEALLLTVLTEILDNNQVAVEQIIQLLERPDTELVYVIGNHDGLFEFFPSAQELVRQRLLQTLPEHLRQPDRVRFVRRLEVPELELYVEHGHRLDPFNSLVMGHKPPLGDVVNILIVNRFVDMVVDRMREQGYSIELIADIHSRLHDIEYLRPLALVPVWMEMMASRYRRHPENKGKRQPVDQIMYSVVSEILHDPEMIRFAVERLRVPRQLFVLFINSLLKFPVILPVVSFLTTKLVRRTHSNKYQYKMAKKLHYEKGYRLIALGHTHIPTVMPLSQNGHYFNTGSWKPVINLFKLSTKEPIDLETLAPNVEFNKIERCGIVRLEKSLLDPSSPTQFALQTIQSGSSV